MNVISTDSPAPRLSDDRSSSQDLVVATFNVDGVRARKAALCQWLAEYQPEVVALQEIKCTDDAFPFEDLKDAGYRAQVYGQKQSHGVALLTPLESEEPMIVCRGLPTLPDDPQARYLEVLVTTASGDSIAVASIYAPNGNPVSNKEKFSHKDQFTRALFTYIQQRLNHEPTLRMILLGDYNITPTKIDSFSHSPADQDATSHPVMRQLWRQALAKIPLLDAWRVLHGVSDPGYTEYFYVGQRLQNNEGFRIDMALLSPLMADFLVSCDADYATRCKPGASDHLPLVCKFRLPTLKRFKETTIIKNETRNDLLI